MTQMNITLKASNLLTDSRFVSEANDACFFAIKGQRHDGHQFIDELASKGVQEFVIEKDVPFIFKGEEITAQENFNSHGCTFWVVNNSIKALQHIVKQKRKQFKLPVIGITGSNGKTIIKEWLSQLLEPSFKVIKTPRSYNSQIGVPLSVWKINAQHDLGIFEAGISKTEEMQVLSEIILPQIGIFTNIGTAHADGFNSQKQKISEKLRLFTGSKYLIYSESNPEVSEEIAKLLKTANPSISLINWHTYQKGRYWATLASKGQLHIGFEGKEYHLEVPFVSAAPLENLSHCIFCLLLLDKISDQYSFSVEQVSPLINALKGVEMRLELKEGINNCQLIDDTYTNDFGGLAMALNFMTQQESNRKKVVILSDFAQEKIKDKDLYPTLASLLKEKGIQEFIGVGPTLKKYKSLFGNSLVFESTEELLASESTLKSISNALLLIKGSRSFAFERIVNLLAEKMHGTVLEINLDALTHNLNYYRALLPPKTKLMVMVKAFSYGSGGVQIASLLQYHRVDYIAVANIDEGVHLRKNGIKLPILVLNPDQNVLNALVDYNLEPEIYSFELLKKVADKPVAIHLKIDTGMNRLGFTEEDLPELLEFLKARPNLKVKSIFSHLAASDEPEHKEFTLAQLALYNKVAAAIKTVLKEPVICHISNTSGISNFPEAALDMVRLGIGLYGIDPTNQAELRTVGTLKTSVLQVKKVSKDATVGYGRKGKVEGTIATLAIGYADGFKRSFSQGKGHVILQGHQCPVVGNICMDLCMVDVTGLNVQAGHTAIVFGEVNPIYEMAAKIDSIPYELLTGIGQRVKRIFLKE